MNLIDLFCRKETVLTRRVTLCAADSVDAAFCSLYYHLDLALTNLDLSQFGLFLWAKYGCILKL